MDRIEEYMLCGFGLRNFDVNEGTAYRYNNFSNNDLYKYFLVAHIDPDGCEIPILFNSLRGNYYRNKCKLVLPLIANGIEQVRIRRLTTTIIADFNSTSYDTRLQCVKTNKGDKYYGAPGIILNKDFKPILILTVKYSLNSIATKGIAECICHIDKSVFLNQDGLLEKTIYKKIIPLYATQIPTDVRLGPYNATAVKMTTVIDDCSNFIERPIPPRPSATKDEYINDLIVRHLDDICH